MYDTYAEKRVSALSGNMKKRGHAVSGSELLGKPMSEVLE